MGPDLQLFVFHRPPIKLLCKLRSSQFLNHSEAAIEWQNQYTGDHHVLPLFGIWRWAPYMRGKFHWKNIKMQGFLKPHQWTYSTKQWDISKSAANIYPSYKYEFFPVFLLLTNQGTLYNLNIVLRFHPPFEPITTLFTITGLWPKTVWWLASTSTVHVQTRDIVTNS